MKRERSNYDLHRHRTTSYAPVFDSRQEIEERRTQLQYNLRVAAGLYPWPERTSLNTKYELVGEYEGYYVQKVMFESFPGMWSTGNLYMPTNLIEPAPAILNVIGHWEEQRLARIPDGFYLAGDYPQQIANFAKMGFICLVTDMIGKVDSRQISHEFGKEPKHEMWLTNGLGVQLWNNIRALDLLCSMPEVDASRIGVTGASGGGSQSLFLSLADDRISALAPINMMSLNQEGGCQCENAPGLRREAINMEMLAVLAPRPVFLAGSTGDWTRNLLTDELPLMKAAYAFYNAEDNVEYFYQDAVHQYNSKTRHEVYKFFAKRLMGKEIEWKEQKIETSDLSAFTWFNGEGHAPGFNNDEEFFLFRRNERREKMKQLSKEERLKMLDWMLGIKDKLFYKTMVSVEEDPVIKNHCEFEQGYITDCHGARILYNQMIPSDWDHKTVYLVLSGEGKKSSDDRRIGKMLKEQAAVISPELFMTGSTAEEAKQRGNDIRHFSTYNYTNDGLRVQEIGLLWQIVNKLAGKEGECKIWAESDAAIWAACAMPLLKNMSSAYLEKAAFEQLNYDVDYHEKCYIPGIMLLGGVQGCLGLSDVEVTFF